jgi:trans-aconitate methyltransferase
MNERIKLLAEQAGYSKDYLAIGLPNNMEKFAELLVRECANRATWAQDTGERDIGGEVLKHFGVRE